MKNCHLLRRKIANFAFASLMALEASIGWATTIQGNLEVIAIPASTTAKGNLTVEGTTTLKGNTTLGNDASDTTTFQGSVKAKGDLTVNGALTIESVDSASAGVITDIGTTNKNDTIPTTQAVKNYIDSVTHSLYDPNVYAFWKEDTDPMVWSLTKEKNDHENNVSKRIGPKKRLVATVYLRQPQGKYNPNQENRDYDVINGELILSSVKCKDFSETHRVDPEEVGYAFNDGIHHSRIIVLTYFNASETSQTLYFCGYFKEYDDEPGVEDKYEFIKTHIAIHPQEITN